eukprot:scaffold1033_cov171-Amphora_coffeaeformis.AAC.35
MGCRQIRNGIDSSLKASTTRPKPVTSVSAKRTRHQMSQISQSELHETGMSNLRRAMRHYDQRRQMDVCPIRLYPETKKKGAAAVRVFIIRFEKYSRGSPKQQDCNRSYHKKPSAVAEVSTIQRQEREVISSLSLITHTTNTNENYGTTMKLSTRRSTAKATSSSLLSSTTKYDTENVSHQNQGDEQTSLFASECQRLYEINLLDFIRGDSHLPERYVFDTDLFPDYSRVTQRRLVDVIQTVCQAQQSPISVHQWANEEHDDRIVRRIRFRCAFFRKKKRFADRKSCGFQFQVCYQQKYGWCLLNGKGHAQHEGHSLPAPEVAPELLKKNNNNQNRKPAAVPSRKKTSPAAVAATVASPKKLYVPPPLSKGEGAAATATPACVLCQHDLQQHGV